MLSWSYISRIQSCPDCIFHVVLLVYSVYPDSQVVLIVHSMSSFYIPATQNHMYCHVTEKAFACEVCEYQCKRMDSLRVHMRRHAPVKPFQCELCGRQYTQKHALEVHMRHHTGITVAECHICQRTFTTK